jgi:hypothetical protein
VRGLLRQSPWRNRGPLRCVSSALVVPSSLTHSGENTLPGDPTVTDLCVGEARRTR